MKTYAFAALLALPCLAQPPAPTMLANHRLGESIQEWLDVNQLDFQGACRNKDKAARKRLTDVIQGSYLPLANEADFACPPLTDALNGKTRQIETKGARQIQWIFEERILTEAVIEQPRPDTEQEIGFLAEKYGAPAKRGTSIFQNAFGAKWECPFALWEMPDGAHISAKEEMKNIRGPMRWLTITFLSKERIEKSRSEQKTKTNPY